MSVFEKIVSDDHLPRPSSRFSAGCKSGTNAGAKHAEEIKVWDYFTGRQQELIMNLSTSTIGLRIGTKS